MGIERSAIDGKERNYTYIGLDISQEMINEANRQHEGKNIVFTTSLPEAIHLVQHLRLQGGASAMTLSAVLHEVIHYQPKHEHAEFWNSVWHENIDYVAIRDFSVDENLESKPTKAESVALVRLKFKDVNFPADHPLAGMNVLDVWENGYDAVESSRDPLLANKSCVSGCHIMQFELMYVEEEFDHGKQSSRSTTSNY